MKDKVSKLDRILKPLKISVKPLSRLSANIRGISFKIILLVLSIVIVLTCFNTGVATYTSYNTMNDLFKANIELLTIREKEYFDSIISNVESMTASLASNTEFLEYGGNIDMMEGGEKVKGIKYINEAISTAINSNKFIQAIYFISNQGKVIYPAGSATIDVSEESSPEWYRKILETEGGIWFRLRKEDFPVTTRLDAVATYGIKFKPRWGNEFVLLYDLKKSIFTESLATMKISETSTSYIIMPGKDILFGEQIDIEDKDMLESEKKLIDNLVHEAAHEKIKTFFYDDALLVSIAYSEESSWIYVNTVEKDEFLTPAKELNMRLILVALISGIVFVSFGIFFSIKLSKPVRQLIGVMNEAENCNLNVTADIKGQDEIGYLGLAFNSMISQIKQIILQNRKIAQTVNASADNIAAISKETASAMNEIARAIEGVASGTAKQSVEVNESNKSFKVLSEKINDMYENVLHIDRTTNEVQRITSKGISTMEKLQSISFKTTEITERVVVSMAALNNIIKEVIKITGILNMISDRTKLLSLNASIEAARAGNNGRGFAVLAQEIRTLADQSASFTKNIEEQIQNIISKTKETTEIVYKSEDIIREQTDIIEESISAFANIQQIISKFIEYTKEISELIKDTENYKEKVMSNLKHIYDVSETNAGTAEEISAATEEQFATTEQLRNMAGELAALARELTNSIGRFQIE